MKRLISQLLIFLLLLQLLGLVTSVFAETINIEYSDPNHLHAPNVVNGVTYEYDANGNLISDGERTIEWNQDNLPIKIKKSDTEVRFFYDASGQRIVKSSKLKVESGEEQETKTVYVNQYLTIEQSGNETIYQKYYFAQGRRIAVTNTQPTSNQQRVTYFLHHDHLGSTVLATDLNSQPLSNSLTYFPYGNSIPNYQLPITNYLYTGQELDSESDLYHYNARLYNPKTGVFISADTVGGGNRYAYAANNPMIFVDPSGHAAYDAGEGGGGSYLPLIIKDYYNGPWIGPVPADASDVIPLWVVDYFLSGKAKNNIYLRGFNISISEALQQYREGTMYPGGPSFMEAFGSFENFIKETATGTEKMYTATWLAAGMTAPLESPSKLKVVVIDEPSSAAGKPLTKFINRAYADSVKAEYIEDFTEAIKRFLIEEEKADLILIHSRVGKVRLQVTEFASRVESPTVIYTYGGPEAVKQLEEEIGIVGGFPHVPLVVNATGGLTDMLKTLLKMVGME